VEIFLEKMTRRCEHCGSTDIDVDAAR
jgi:hypothetical protein